MNTVEQSCQLIGEKLIGIIPDEWNKIYLYAEVLSDMVVIYFYFESATLNEIIYYHNIPEIYGVD